MSARSRLLGFRRSKPPKRGVRFAQKTSILRPYQSTDRYSYITVLSVQYNTVLYCTLLYEISRLNYTQHQSPDRDDRHMSSFTVSYNHLFPQTHKRQFCYESLSVASPTQIRADGGACVAASSRFLAYPAAAGGGSCVAVLGLDSYGRRHVPTTAKVRHLSSFLLFVVPDAVVPLRNLSPPYPSRRSCRRRAGAPKAPKAPK